MALIRRLLAIKSIGPATAPDLLVLRTPDPEPGFGIIDGDSILTRLQTLVR